ncbi:hypothetical protein C2845_PM02G04680 [Panicum miliaceum]|uniref:Uncharacterized protein n=1 Tax=Panicum miliaceum TaxID=4540 RepID=A0A3L6S4T4_PANMI|nr:hypothetical protein C2845_PM02G04680 [Panicum miliaceum]
MAAAEEEAAAAPPDGGAESESAEMSAAGVMEGEEREAAADSTSTDRPPHRLYHFARQFRSVAPATGSGSGENFLKGVKWSPDGSSFLTSSDDNSLRLFYLPEDAYGGAEHVAEAAVGGEDSYGAFLQTQPPVFASTSRDHPIHLWDATSGELRCTYRAYDAMDEIAAALSISFNSTGSKLFAGYNKAIRVFDVHRPGRDFEQYSLLKGGEGPTGIISSISFSLHNGMLAVGSYSQTTAVYAESNMEPLYVLHGQLGGVTQVLFSKDGNYLYTGGRKDPYILCWDIRNTVDIVYKLYRSADTTNQRIYFDIEPCGRHLATGGQDGMVHVYDLQGGQWVTGFQAAADTVNGFSFHPYLPFAVTSSRHRRFGMQDEFEDELNMGADRPMIYIAGGEVRDTADTGPPIMLSVGDAMVVRMDTVIYGESFRFEALRLLPGGGGGWHVVPLPRPLVMRLFSPFDRVSISSYFVKDARVWISVAGEGIFSLDAEEGAWRMDGVPGGD